MFRNCDDYGGLFCQKLFVFNHFSIQGKKTSAAMAVYFVNHIVHSEHEGNTFFYECFQKIRVEVSGVENMWFFLVNGHKRVLPAQRVLQYFFSFE